MISAYPCIRVNDIETTIMWYVDFLKFQCVYKNTIKNPEVALLEKDDLKIYLMNDESQDVYASNVIMIETSDINKEFLSLDKAGVIIITSIDKGDFPGKNFVIKDYEDNKIIFVQKI